jgi:hypothetical protein
MWDRLGTWAEHGPRHCQLASVSWTRPCSHAIPVAGTLPWRPCGSSCAYVGVGLQQVVPKAVLAGVEATRFQALVVFVCLTSPTVIEGSAVGQPLAAPHTHT